jgi:alpha-glucosidase
MMRKELLMAFCLLVCLAETDWAIDLNGLEQIGPVTSLTKTERSVTFNCKDNSQVHVVALADDLIRVRVSFRAPLPARDHSWAIAKEEWSTPECTIIERATEVLLITDEIEVVVQRSPLLIEFRDARTHRVINADERPMMYDPKGTTIAAAKRLGFDEHFYGLGEKAARLDKRREQFTMWNSDTPGYKEGTDPIYQSIPFYIGWERGAAYGIFFDNSYRTYFDFGKSSQMYSAFSADGGEMNYYFFHGPSIKKILSRYTELTGRMPLPPMWALGPQQSRWSYYPQSVAEEVVRGYRARDLPLDVLHLDIDYMSGYRVFTFNTDRFPDPKAFTDKMRQQGVKVITIVDPGVKYQPPGSGAPKQSNANSRPELASHDKSYYVFNQGMEKNYFLRRRNGNLYIPKVWPGDSVFVDYTLPDARRWWGDLHRAYTDNGIAGIWTDMNEPADFVDQTGKAQMDVINYDKGENSTHAKNRNVFALLMARATYEGLERLQPDKRPYIITRAAYAGIQRYSTMWTGDTNSTWDSLAISVPIFQTLGLSGESFVGADIGGFIGRGNGELLTRSYQVGFLTPFCRNHKVIDGYDQEPWRFGKYYEDIIRKYLKLRYRLLPFLYTTLEESHRTGVPLFRPLLLNYEQDYNTINIDDQFMIGTELLVAPILKPDVTSRSVYLPEGVWFDYWTGKKYSGPSVIRVDAPLEVVPMFVRGGAIIPMGPEMNYIGEKSFDPISFDIYPDDKGRAATTLYEDDGTSPAYKRGVFRRTHIRATSNGRGWQLNLDAPEGSYQPRPRALIFNLKTTINPRSLTLDGKPLAPRSVDKSNGWTKSLNGISVRIADDGKAHRIEIN